MAETMSSTTSTTAAANDLAPEAAAILAVPEDADTDTAATTEENTTTDRSNNGSSNINKTKNSSETMAVLDEQGREVAVPPKKNKSAYFHFMTIKRSEILAEQSKVSFGRLVQLATDAWHNLSQEEKEVFEKLAKEDKTRYQTQVALLLKRTGVDHSKVKKSVDDLESTGTILPVTRVRKVVRLDPDVKQVSGEAFTVITKATDLFVAYLTEHAYHNAVSRKKKKIDLVDVVSSIYSGPEALDFLVPDFDKPMQVQREMRASVAAKKRQKLHDAPVVGNGHDVRSMMQQQMLQQQQQQQQQQHHDQQDQHDE